MAAPSGNRSLDLLHLANHHSTNIGNGALIFGLERTLREDLGPMSFSAEPWDEYTLTGTRRFDKAFVEKVNRHDGWLIGAAVAMNPWPDFPNSGFRVDLPLDAWKKIEKPTIFYGLSYRLWPDQVYPGLEQYKRALGEIFSHPKMVWSVRNDGTKDWLAALTGMDLSKVQEVPDPALFVPVQDFPHPELDPNRLNVVLSLNNEDEVHRFGGEARRRAWTVLNKLAGDKALSNAWKNVPGWDASRTRLLKGIADALDRFSKEQDLNLILAPHTFDDFPISQEFLKHCPRKLAYQKTVSTGIWRVPQAALFYDLYAKADISLSMRVHSMSPSIGQGTPTVALCSQTRMTHFMDDAGLSDFKLDVFDPELSDKLLATLKRIASDREAARAQVKAAVAKMRERTRRFNLGLKPMLGL
jgi:hypothetical protein